MFVLVLLVAHTVGWLPPVSGAVAWHRAVSAILILLLFAVFARYSLRWRQSLADELAAARDEAIHHNTLKDQFIAHLNHEIRTPLNALATATEVLSKQPLAPLPRTLVDAQLVAARHLLSLINNVLDHARLTSAGVALDAHPFRVSDVVTQVATMFGPSAADKGLPLQVLGAERETGARLGDATRLRQILANLTSNAVKFTVHGGADRGDGRAGTDAADRIDDSGARHRLGHGRCGAAAAVHAVRSTRRLGAAASRWQRSRAGDLPRAGHIDGGHDRRRIRAVEGQLLHVDAADAARGRCRPRCRPASPSGARTPVQALLVEDDVTNRVIVAAALEQLGARVDMAESGEVALQRFRASTATIWCCWIGACPASTDWRHCDAGARWSSIAAASAHRSWRSPATPTPPAARSSCTRAPTM